MNRTSIPLPFSVSIRFHFLIGFECWMWLHHHKTINFFSFYCLLFKIFIYSSVRCRFCFSSFRFLILFPHQLRFKTKLFADKNKNSDSNATDFLGNSLRRGTPSDCCHTDSNTSTGNQMQQQNTPITQLSFGEDDSSCDSHTRWGMYGLLLLKIAMKTKMEEKKENVCVLLNAAVVFFCCYCCCWFDINSM